MTFYLKGNETLKALLELCRLHHLTTPIIALERFRDFDMWVVTIDNDEKAEHPTHETTGGYLKVLDESECAQVWWDGLSGHQKNIIKELPNFDSEIFEQCTGIRI